ncbi:MAG: phosphopantothenate/pantothenate synthetase [Caldisphaera sp.]|nr:MAG: phosphopantothenate/pantothenate synthetase [Caldisphaera sp.]
MSEDEIPKTHPRYQSLITREKLVKFFNLGIVVAQGLVAQGRGEAFDYILGEKTHNFALEAEKITVASILTSKNPVISVNGNYAALAGEEIVRLSDILGVPIEVNLFHRTEERIKKIENYLKDLGGRKILGSECKKAKLPNLDSPRGIVCEEGIFNADFVLLAIEDGDRTLALKNLGKKVAAIDLNPFSRTAQTANITIVDDAIRATKNMIQIASDFSQLRYRDLLKMLESYDNKKNLSLAFEKMFDNLKIAYSKGILQF